MDNNSSLLGNERFFKLSISFFSSLLLLFSANLSSSLFDKFKANVFCSLLLLKYAMFSSRYSNAFDFALLSSAFYFRFSIILFSKENWLSVFLKFTAGIESLTRAFSKSDSPMGNDIFIDGIDMSLGTPFI